MSYSDERKTPLKSFINNPSKSMWNLAIPIMVGMGIQTLYTIIDMIFIGRLGGDAIAAVAFNMPIFFFVMGLSFGLGNGVTASIFVSYASSHVNEFSLFGTNGHITIRENILKIFSPRDTFTESGNFTSPPMIKEENFDLEKNYRDSLSNSLNYFLDHVKNLSNIPLIHFDTSLNSNNMIFNLNS